MPAELISESVGLSDPRGRKLDMLLGFLDLLMCVCVWERRINANANVDANYKPLKSDKLFGPRVLSTVLAHLR